MNTTKDFILGECLKLFLRKSFKDVTLKEIVETTRLSKGAFYHYFTSKESLFLEVIDTFFTKMIVFDFGAYSQESLFRFYHDHINDLGKMVTELTDINGSLSIREIPDFNYLYPLFDALRMIPEYHNKIQKAREYELEQWTMAIERAMASGEIKSLMAAGHLAKMFIFSGNGIGLNIIMSNRPAGDIKESFTDLWDGFYESLKS
ncbi:MAG TPA: TetR/AcrR family transcriptional regulator [Bacteroidales bacterium]|nr:TetR/AcrR family transcriptional regulator [Bacteroidales bacterium]